MNVYYFLHKQSCKKYSEYLHISSMLQEVTSRYGIGDKSVDKTVYKNEEFNIKVLSLHSTPRKIHEELGLTTSYDKKSAIRVYFKKLLHKSFKIPTVRGILPGSILHYFRPYAHKKRTKFTKVLEITSLKEYTTPEFFENSFDIFHCIRLTEEADVIITHSEYMAEELRSKLFADENKIKVIPRGFNIEPGTEKAENYVVFCGRIARYKNLELLIKAFDAAAPKGLQLLIVGDTGCEKKRSSLENTYFEHIKKLTKELPKDRIKMLGHLPYEKTISLMKKAKLLIEPSYINDFPDTIIEAQLCGVPVIASDIPAHKSVCGQSVAYFSVLSQASLEERIRTVTSETKRANDEMIKVGRTNAKKYSWDETSQEYRSLYKSL